MYNRIIDSGARDQYFLLLIKLNPEFWFLNPVNIAEGF